MATEQAQKLSDFIDQIAEYTQIENVGNTHVVRHTNPVLVHDSTFTFVASASEPVDLVLPLNVVWINFDPASAHYRKAFARVSKQTSEDTAHTWQRITEYDALWASQYYDSDDDGLSSNPDASSGLIGVVRLTVASATPGDPIVVVEGDPTLTDDRPPLPHDAMHPEVAATRLATTGRAVIIENGQPVENGGMVSDFQGDSSWGTLPRTLIYPAVTPLVPAEAKVFTDIENDLISADIVLL